LKYQVIVMPSAEVEVEAAYQWLSERAPEAAIQWHQGMVYALHSLETFPFRCPIAPESKIFNREIRRLLYGKRQYAYRILFEVVCDTVRVIHIRPGARDYLTPETGKQNGD
jgi:hypothetical protein